MSAYTRTGNPPAAKVRTISARGMGQLGRLRAIERPASIFSPVSPFNLCREQNENRMNQRRNGFNDSATQQCKFVVTQRFTGSKVQMPKCPNAHRLTGPKEYRLRTANQYQPLNMEYLLIEKRAWLQMQADAKRANERMQELERHFFPAGDSG